jgi:hypothetical protein
MAGLVPAIHVFFSSTIKTWMPGTSPGMTKQLDVTKQKGPGKPGPLISKTPADQRE